jgi:hypothetical protein
MRYFLSWCAVGVLAAATWAADTVPVPGSAVAYPTQQVAVADAPIGLDLTGVALRTKAFFSVYTIGSYLQNGVRATSATELAQVNAAKRLHLVMERTVAGKDIADAFVAGIRLNYPATAFPSELETLGALLRPRTVKKGDHVCLTYVPGKGLHCQLLQQAEVTIDNPAFAQAVWEIYLGTNNLGSGIQQGLTSRLKK